MHIHRWVDIETTTILIILPVSLVPSNAVLKTRNVCVCNTSTLNGDMCKVVKLCIFVVLFLCFILPLVTTTRIDHC